MRVMFTSQLIGGGADKYPELIMPIVRFPTKQNPDVGEC